MIQRVIGAAALGIAAVCASTAASAHVDVGVFVNTPPPVYAAPAVVYPPPPVTYVPAPAYGYRDDYWRERRWHDHGRHHGWWKHHGRGRD